MAPLPKSAPAQIQLAPERPIVGPDRFSWRAAPKSGTERHERPAPADSASVSGCCGRVLRWSAKKVASRRKLREAGAIQVAARQMIDCARLSTLQRVARTKSRPAAARLGPPRFNSWNGARRSRPAAAAAASISRAKGAPIAAAHNRLQSHSSERSKERASERAPKRAARRAIASGQVNL